MAAIEFNKARIRFNDSFALHDIDWNLQPGQVWAVVGASGAGKSALGAALTGEGKLETGNFTGKPEHAALVSLETQARLIERERLLDDSDLTDRVFEGTPVGKMLAETCQDIDLQNRLIKIFRLTPLLDRGFRKLSTGESRKVLFTRALCSKPALLVVDGPFEGLDAEVVPLLADVLRQLTQQTRLVLVINRFDELPDYVTHVALVENGRLSAQVETSDQAAMALLDQLFHLKTADVEIPPAIAADSAAALDPDHPLVNIKDASIRYTDNLVFEHLDWRIEPGQHWQLTGPNGSGKTCLLNLITGDHPQCYSNDIFVCGYKRGNGESIWDIKQHIGYLSSALQWDYRVSISAMNVIISGFYDSIGLYAKATDLQKDVALQWLQVLGLGERKSQPFKQFSFGDQRLLLIARAMVKHPPLLILDEPCFGLDDISRQLVLALIERICSASESTVIYVNHHADDHIEGINQFLALRLTPQ